MNVYELVFVCLLLELIRSFISLSHTHTLKLLQTLVTSNDQQARAYSTRALFHKFVTVRQLESLLTCLQCLKRTYLICEEELKTQANQVRDVCIELSDEIQKRGNDVFAASINCTGTNCAAFALIINHVYDLHDIDVYRLGCVAAQTSLSVCIVRTVCDLDWCWRGLSG